MKNIYNLYDKFGEKKIFLVYFCKFLDEFNCKYYYCIVWY